MKRVGWSNRKIKHQLNQVDIKKNSSSEVSHVIAKIKKKELQLTIIWVVIILVILVSSSYVIFSSVQKREKYNTLKTGSLLVNYHDISTGMGDVVTLISNSNTSPMIAEKQEPYVFEITNEGKKTVNYEIILKDDIDMIEIDGCRKQLLDKSTIWYKINKEPARQIEYSNHDDQIVLLEGSISAEETEEYKILIWAEDSVKTTEIPQHYHGKIVVSNKESN